MIGKCDVDSVRSLCQFERRPRLVSEQIGTSHRAWELLDVEVAFRPCEDLNIDSISGGRRTPVPCRDKLLLTIRILLRGAGTAALIAEESRVGAVDCFAIDRQPLANLPETLNFCRWDSPHRVWS